MSTTIAPAPPKLKPAMPKKPPQQNTPTENHTPKEKLSISSGPNVQSQKIVIYGPGGIGKTKLASLIEQVGIQPLFLDLDQGSKFLDVKRLEPETWNDLRSCLIDKELTKPFGAIIIDSGTKAEELALNWTLENIPSKSDRDGTIQSVNSMEGYGWGKGY